MLTGWKKMPRQYVTGAKFHMQPLMAACRFQLGTQRIYRRDDHSCCG